MLFLTLYLALATPPTPPAPVGAPATAVPTGTERPAVHESPRLLVLHLEPANISDAEGRAIDAIVLAGARSDDVVLVSQTELQQLAALDAAAQGAGCESSSCLAELAGAFGARYVLFGTSSRLGSTTTISLAVLDAAEGTTVRDTVTVDHLDALPQRLPERVRAIVAQALRGHEPSRSEPTSTDGALLTTVGVVAAAIGGGTVVGALGVAAWQEFLILRSPTVLADEKRDAQWRGVVALVVAGGGAIVGALGVVALGVGGAE